MSAGGDHRMGGVPVTASTVAQPSRAALRAALPPAPLRLAQPRQRVHLLDLRLCLAQRRLGAAATLISRYGRLQLGTAGAAGRGFATGSRPAVAAARRARRHRRRAPGPRACPRQRRSAAPWPPRDRQRRPTHARASTSSRRPSETRRSAMSSGQSRSARISSHGHSSVNDDVRRRSWIHGIGRERDLASAGRRAQRRQERQVDAEQPVLRGDGLHQPDGPPERRRARPRLADPHRVRARLDLAEVLLVDARRDLVQRDLAGHEVRPDDHRHRAVEVARRAVALDALDVQPRLAAERLEARLDAARLLAGERPPDELAEELREARPARSSSWPSGRSSRTSRRRTCRARTATGRGGDRRAARRAPAARPT